MEGESPTLISWSYPTSSHSKCRACDLEIRSLQKFIQNIWRQFWHSQNFDRTHILHSLYVLQEQNVEEFLYKHKGVMEILLLSLCTNKQRHQNNGRIKVFTLCSFKIFFQDILVWIFLRDIQVSLEFHQRKLHNQQSLSTASRL